MKITIQLGRFVSEEMQRRGVIQEIAQATGLERHTIAALLRSNAKYVSLDALGRICDYLIKHKHVSPDILPAALFGKQRDGFWKMLADRTRLEFCLATRRHPEWPDNDYVMANDSHLQGVLLSMVSALDVPQSEQADHAAAQRVFVDPHLVPAPCRVRARDSDNWQTRTDGQARAADIYETFRRSGDSAALITLGSVKVNGVLEVLLGDIFSATPFQTQDQVTLPRQRRCPFYFRYRAHDPTPESLCGGTQLSKREAPETPGIYYETEDGSWACCPCEDGVCDVAFVFYAYRPPVDELQLACGGFSGLATRYLAERFGSVASDFWEPQFRSSELEVGLYLVTFPLRKQDKGKIQGEANANFDQAVVRLHKDVLKRRLAKKKRRGAKS